MGSEGIAQHAHRLAGERLGDDRPRLVRGEDALLEARKCPCLRGGNEAGADPDAVGSKHQGRGQATPIEDSACRNDGNRTLHGINNHRDERQRGDLTGVTSGLGSLGDHEVAAGIDCTAGVLDPTAHICHEDPGLVAPLNCLGRYPESCHEESRSSFDEQVDETEHVARHCRKEVDGEWLGGGGLDGGHLVDQLVLAHRRGSEAAIPARLGDGGSQPGVGNPTHAGEHHGVLDSEHLRQASLHQRPPQAVWP